VVLAQTEVVQSHLIGETDALEQILVDGVLGNIPTGLGIDTAIAKAIKP
jgi:hypothetical protein